MIGFILFAMLMNAPEPRPYPDAIPSKTFQRAKDDGKTVSWGSRPNRKTNFWRVSGLLFCDDPGCPLCGPNVYPFVREPEVVPIRR